MYPPIPPTVLAKVVLKCTPVRDHTVAIQEGNARQALAALERVHDERLLRDEVHLTPISSLRSALQALINHNPQKQI